MPVLSNPPHPIFRLLLGCLLLVVAAQLAACGSRGESAADSVARYTPMQMPDGGWVLRRGNGAEPETLDPQRVQSVNASNIVRDLYEGLVSTAADGTLVPGVAQSWEVSPDGLVYVFHLRPTARWSNGKPVTAADFVYSLRRLVNPETGSPYAAILKPVANAEAIIQGEQPPTALGVQALDAHTLKIQLHAPTPYFLGLMAHASSYPSYQPVVEKYGDAFTRPGNNVSNGAYVIKEWVTGGHILLEKNPYYWNRDQVRIQYVKYLPVSNVDSEFKRYLAGELELTSSVPIPQLQWIRRNLSQEMQVHPVLGLYYYGLNDARAPFKDKPKLRQALAMAIDRQILVEKVVRGGELPAYAWVPPGVANYTPQKVAWANWTQAKRNARALELYHQAGYSSEHPLQVQIRYNSSDGHRKIALAIAWMWKQALGVQVQLVNEEWKVFLQNVRLGELTQVYRMGWFGDYNDANTFLELMHSGFGMNGTGYHSAAYDALVDAAAAEPDAAKRRSYLQAAERQLLQDMPAIPLYHYVSKHLLKPYVKGYVGNVLDRHSSKDLWIDPAAISTARPMPEKADPPAADKPQEAAEPAPQPDAAPAPAAAAEAQG